MYGDYCLSIIVCFIGFYIYLAKYYSKSHKVNYMYNVCVCDFAYLV